MPAADPGITLYLRNKRQAGADKINGLLPLAMGVAVFERLGRAPSRRLVEIGEGRHLRMLERNRMQLIHEVQLFLDEPRG